MDIVEAMRSRKSIRGYKPEPVPKETIEEILGVATRSPSGENGQPWELVVVAGDILVDIGRMNIEKFTSGTIPHPEVGMSFYQGVYKRRQVDLATQLFQLMGIAREDSEARMQWLQRGCRFFDAPVGVFILEDASINMMPTLVDLGCLAQSICLTALKYGLGSCIQQQGVFYPEIVREVAGIPENKRVLLCVTLGYPDWDFPANRVQSEREPVGSISSWLGFE